MLDHVRFALAVVAVSYLTLVVLSMDKARDYWWEYAVVAFILETVNFTGGRLDDRRRRKRRSTQRRSIS